MDGRAQLLFDLGDMIEESLMRWLERAGLPHVRTDSYSRDTIRISIAGTEIGVRPDFVFQDGQELIGGEIKSMSDFAFLRFQNGTTANPGLDESYLAQVEVNLRALNLQRWLVVGYRKETSHLHEQLITRNDERWQRINANLAMARSDLLPDRPYKLDAECSGCDGTGKTPTGREHKSCQGTGQEPGGPFLPTFPCGYCAYKGECWGGRLELVMRRGKPRWRAMQSQEHGMHSRAHAAASASVVTLRAATPRV